MDLLKFKERYIILKNRYLEISKYLKIDEINKKLINLKEITLNENFWLDKIHATQILKDISKFEYDLKLYSNIKGKYEDLSLCYDLCELNNKTDEESLKILSDFNIILKKLEIKEILKDKDDFRDAILQIHPGAGGVESQDWASMLYRLYSKWVKNNNFHDKLLEYQAGDDAGIKDVIIEIKGEYAYGLLKSEMGVHRLVRISPFDSKSKRHTSFASVFVYPIIEDDVEVFVSENDIKVDTYRASGAGGQHVNKTDSAVRITHIETGITVQCQNQRSQLKNKTTAIKLLKAKLYQEKLNAIMENRSKTNNAKKDISWGSQIRSYIFHPYNLVKDHRTNFESTDVNAVMNGEISDFIKNYLLKRIAS